ALRAVAGTGVPDRRRPRRRDRGRVPLGGPVMRPDRVLAGAAGATALVAAVGVGAALPGCSPAWVRARFGWTWPAAGPLAAAATPPLAVAQLEREDHRREHERHRVGQDHR